MSPGELPRSCHRCVSLLGNVNKNQTRRGNPVLRPDPLEKCIFVISTVVYLANPQWEWAVDSRDEVLGLCGEGSAHCWRLSQISWVKKNHLSFFPSLYPTCCFFLHLREQSPCSFPGMMMCPSASVLRRSSSLSGPQQLQGCAGGRKSRHFPLGLCLWGLGTWKTLLGMCVSDWQL